MEETWAAGGPGVQAYCEMHEASGAAATFS